MHTYTHAYIHTYIYRYIHVCNVYLYPHMHTYMPMHGCLYIHIYIYIIHIIILYQLSKTPTGFLVFVMIASREQVK